MPALAPALYLSAMLGQYDDNRAEVERLASDLIELSTRQDFAFFLPIGEMLRGWVLSVSGSTAEGIAWIYDGMRRYQGTGSMLKDRVQEPMQACRSVSFASEIASLLAALQEAISPKCHSDNASKHRQITTGAWTSSMTDCMPPERQIWTG
jgi:hypothetical protein